MGKGKRKSENNKNRKQNKVELQTQQASQQKKFKAIMLSAAGCLLVIITVVVMLMMSEDLPNPIVTIEMEDGGVIKLELYPDMAPNTVKNFVSLAKSGFYDGTIFHRVISGFMIQGGDPDGTGTGGPGYSIKAEFANAGFTQNTLSHTPGVISMARQGNQFNPPAAYNTAGCQFFIVHGNATSLDRDYTAFGMVIEGMDIVNAIAAVATGANDRPVQEQRMKAVTVETFGVEWGEPETLPR